VLHALQDIAAAAQAEGKPVTICGELAGEPGAAILLMAMGYDVLSMSATSLPRVKHAIRNITMQTAREILARVMQLDDAEMIYGFVESKLNDLKISQGLRRVVKKSA
jgi:phosphotransferase system enzyme I (PtsP)